MRLELSNVTPTIQLEEMVKLAHRITNAKDNPDLMGAAFILDSIRMCQLFLELHLFMAAGNAMPKEWVIGARAGLVHELRMMTVPEWEAFRNQMQDFHNLPTIERIV